MKKGIGFGIIILTLVLSLMGCSSSSANESGQKEKLVMGTSADFAPFESRNSEGEFVGFDIELAHAIAEELGYELEIKDMKFDGLIGALQTNRVDMVLAGMSATEKRSKNVDFSTEYNHSGEIFVFSEATISSVEELEGKTVGVQLGTIQEEGAKKLQEEVDFDIKLVDNSTTLIQELNSNRIDVAYMDKAAGEGYMKEQNLEGFDDPTSSSPGMAVAFPVESELVEDVNQVLKKMEENGELDKLKEKWLQDS
ncbi:ABC transporter substrate-binding protein [Thalassobacillus hwangdonensis]|uniref:ABC transporter substrate-binding protein n=1 Tax=Thalassobacillus hwangdonensis TaxID=546108 RepID=A0ABW3L153_9BACI